MHLRFLKIYCDVVDLGSFSRAAAANDVSQSNASQVVHHLEEHLGLQLIDRSRRPFVVTPEGKRFRDGCRVIVQRYEDLEREVRAMHEATEARLTVASIYSVGLAHMSRYLREFLATHPKADVRLEYVHPHRVYEAVDQGQADLGLVSYPEESPSLAALPWRNERVVLVCHPQNAFTGRRSVSLEMLRGESFVAFQAGLKIREEIDRVLSMAKVPVRIELEFDNIETIKRAIEIGAGVSLLPEPTIAREIEAGSLVQIGIEGEPIVRPLGIIHRRDRELSKTAREFIQLLQTEGALPVAVEMMPAESQLPVEANGHLPNKSRKKAKLAS